MTCGSAYLERLPRRNFHTDEQSHQNQIHSSAARSKWASIHSETATNGGDASHRSKFERRKGGRHCRSPPVRDLVACRRKITCPIPCKSTRTARIALSHPEEEPPASPVLSSSCQNDQRALAEGSVHKVPKNKNASPSSQMARRFCLFYMARYL